MTKNELNRDVRRLARRWNAYLDLPRLPEEAKRTPEQVAEDARRWEEREAIGEEMERLHNVDSSAEYLNKKSILIILSMNLCLRVIPLHQVFLPCHKTAGFTN